MRSPGTAPTATMSDQKISTLMDVGAMFPTTDRYGSQQQRQVTGLLIGMDAGCGSHTGAGPGFPMNRGDGRRITTDAGSCMTARGSGGLVSLTDMPTIVRSGLPRMFRSSGSAAAVAMDLGSDSVPWAGSRSVRVTASIHGGVDTVHALM